MAALFAVAALACAGGAAAQPASALSVASVRPVSSAVPASVDFGSVQQGASSDPAPVTLTNSGAGSLSLSRFGIASSSVNATDFGVVAGGTCSLSVSLANGESCTVLVRFKPTVATGQRSGLLSFWDNTLAGRINVTLTGAALPPAEAALSPAVVDFGSVQVGSSSGPVTVTLTNSGLGTLSFWRFGIASSSANPSDFRVVSGGTCALTLGLTPGEMCTVLVRFKPTGSGVRGGLLSFWDNTPTGRHDTVLSGTASAAPESSLAIQSVDFGLLPLGASSDAATLTITNSGSGSLSFWRIGIASSSANPGDFAVVPGGTCALSSPLASGESCDVLVRFRPTAGGARSGLLSFWDNTVAGRIDVTLSGSGDDPCANGCF